MIDPIDELVARSMECPGVRAFHEFHRSNPEVLDFLVEEIHLRLSHGFDAFAYRSLWEYCRWKLEMSNGPSRTYQMNDHLCQFYARAIVILYPEFNGKAELRPSKADAVFGTRLEPARKKRIKNYARRLQWKDGTPIQDGWRPSISHAVKRAVSRKADIHERASL